MIVPRRRQPMRNRGAAVAVLGLGLLQGCIGSSGRGPENVPDLGWPPDDPRVRLERIISSQRDLARRSLLSRITGKRETALFVRPYGVAWDGDTIVVADPGAGRVLRIDPDGRVKRSPDGMFESPIGVASCAQGIVVADSRMGRVVTLDDNLHIVEDVATGLERPTGVACLNGRIAVVETGAHHVAIFGPEAQPQVIGQRGTNVGQFNFPAAIAQDGNALWVGDTLNFRLQQIDPASGSVARSFGQLGDSPGETPRIKGIAVDAAGHVWVSDGHLDTIALYTGDGTLLMEMGGTGSDPGRLSFPAGLAAHPDGRVAVADSLNRRIQIYRLVTTKEMDHE